MTAPHAVGLAFLEEMRRVGNQVPPHVGEALVGSMHNMLVQAFPGSVELKSAVSVMVVANVLADLVSSIEPASPITVPEADGRVKALVSAFVDVLHNAIRDRSVNAHLARNVRAQGGLLS